MPDIKLRLVARPALNAKVRPGLAGSVEAGTAIDVERNGTQYTVSLDLSGLATRGAVSPAERDNLWIPLYDSELDTHSRSDLETFADAVIDAMDPTLVAIGGLAPGANEGIYFTDTDIAGTFTLTAGGRGLSGVSGAAADKIPYFTSPTAASVSDFTAAGRAMVGAASAAAQTALLDNFVGDTGSGGTKGLVPAPAAGSAIEAQYLRADGLFRSLPRGATPIVHQNFAHDFSATTIVVLDGSSDNYHRHFGGVAEGINGRLHLFYRRAVEHALTSGETVYYCRSDDGGQEWSAEEEIVPALAGFDHRSCSVCVTPNGRLILIYDRVVVPTAAPTLIKVKWSDDNGETWVDGADLVSVAYSYARAFGRIKVVPKVGAPGWRLVTTPYYQSSATPTYKVACWYSDDNGETWVEGTPIVDSVDGYTEAELVAINSSVWFASARSSSGLGLYKSTDSGATWSLIGTVSLTSSDSQVAPTVDKFYYRGKWYLLLGYTNRANDTAVWRIAEVSDALVSASAFGGAITTSSDMVNASGYQSVITRPNGAVYVDGGFAFVEFKEYVGQDYSQVRFVRANLFDLAASAKRIATIASGVVTLPLSEMESSFFVDTEAAAASDDCDTINGGYEGQVATFESSTGSRDTIFKAGTGNLILIGGDFRLETAGASGSRIVLRKVGTRWFEVARTNDRATAQAAHTIASGVITVASSLIPLSITVDTEAAAGTDDLDTINGGMDGQIIILSSASSSRDPTAKDATGNLALVGDFIFTNGQDTLMLMKKGSAWLELGRNDNTA